MRRVLLLMILLPLIGGCASNCSLLSSNNSLGCDAMLAGGAILAAPILAPAALISDAASDAKSRRMAREWQAEMTQKLADNDPQAIHSCLQECDTRWLYEIERRDRAMLKREAAQRYLDSGWQQTPEDERQAYRLLALHALSWQAVPTDTEEEEKTSYQLASENVRQSHALLKDKAVRKRIRDLTNSSRATKIETDIYSTMYAVDASDDDDAARAQFTDCPRNMAALAPELGQHYMHGLCRRAYSYRFREDAPSELSDAWQQEFRRSTAKP